MHILATLIISAVAGLSNGARDMVLFTAWQAEAGPMEQCLRPHGAIHPGDQLYNFEYRPKKGPRNEVRYGVLVVAFASHQEAAQSKSLHAPTFFTVGRYQMYPDNADVRTCVKNLKGD